jgi:hypothetical protein
MDINPFDQFSSELGGALPGQNGGNAAPEPTLDGPGSFDLAPKQPEQKKPVMNIMGNGPPPDQNGSQQQGQAGGGGYGGYGGPPQGGGFGQPPQQQWGQPSQQQPPQMGGGQFNNALVPSAQQSNPYALGGIQQSDMQQQGGYGGMNMGGPPPPSNGMQQGPGAFGAPPSQQQQQQQAPGAFGGPPPQQQQPSATFGAPGGSGFDDMFGGGGGASVASGQAPFQPQSPQRHMQGSVQGPPPPAPAPAPPAGGGFDDIFGGGGPPTAPAPAPPAPAGPPAPYGGELTQGNVPVDNMFGGPPQGQAPPSSLAPGGDAGFGGLFDSAPAAAPLQIANDPWGGPTAYDNSTALVPSNAVDDDPFGIFGAGGPPPPGPAPVENAAPSNGGYAERSGPGSVVAPTPTEVPEQQKSAPITRGEGGLPSGGEFYDAKIFTPTLGVMFFKPQELTDSLFLQTDRDLVNALDDRPVVAFIVEGSSARSAGVELGHVLLKVNGIDVKNPKEASRLIKEGPRPLPLLFYVPDTTVVVAEGEHMVKYDTRETGAPPSSKDWKPKYVVVGGIIAQSWMLNMYRSKVSCQIEQNLDFFL